MRDERMLSEEIVVRSFSGRCSYSSMKIIAGMCKLIKHTFVTQCLRQSRSRQVFRIILMWLIKKI